MYDYGYVASIFYKKDINIFVEIVNKSCRKIDLYGDKGNVAHKLHLTFLYGIIEQQLDLVKLNLYLKSTKLSTLKLGKLKLMKGYKDFNILYVEIIDDNNAIKNIYKDLKQFPFEPSVQHDEFIPHMALAYVNLKYKINTNMNSLIPNELKVKDVKYFGIN